MNSTRADVEACGGRAARRKPAETRSPARPAPGILRGEGMRFYCAVPLTSPLRRLDALIFASREEDALGESDVEFLKQLSSHVALAAGAEQSL
jgi:GAF domain-containing protein